MKDNFSIQSKQYALFRPTYPKELFDHLIQLVDEKKLAWDCGTGNGQAASILAEHFEQVHASDISQKQLDVAAQKFNIIYKNESAEHSSLADHSCDLIIVAQAIHWFDFEAFYKEVKRVAKQYCIIAAIGYGLMEIDHTTDSIINNFYENIIGDYWDKERKYIDEMYQTIPFPFRKVQSPSFSMKYEWSLEQLIGYLNTWSAVQHFIKKNDQNPVEIISGNLRKTWKENELKTVTYHLFMQVGKVERSM